MSDAVARRNPALEGRYRLRSELGEGGMAKVYLAVHQRRPESRRGPHELQGAPFSLKYDQKMTEVVSCRD